MSAIINATLSDLDIANPVISQSGSFPLRTFLPEGDIDLSIFLNKDCEDAILQFDLLHELKVVFEKMQLDECSGIKQVCYVNLADVKVLKVNARGINVDVTFRQYGGSLSLQFLEYINLIFDSRLETQLMFFKMCIILCKAYIN